MSFQGRSPDDLPLAAYSKGAVADEPDEEIDAEASHPVSQQEAVALAMGIDAPAKPEAEPAAAPRGPGHPRLSLPRPSLPRFSLPHMPRLGFRSRTAAVADSPFHLEPPAMSMSVAQVRAAMPAALPAATPTAMPAATPRATGAPGWARRLDLGDLGTKLRNPRTAVRDPRVLFGGLIGVGVILLGVSLLGGGNSAGGPVPGASASAAPGIGVPAGPGPATVVVEGRSDGTFTLTGTEGFGKPTDGRLASTWADGTGTVLSLSGPVGGTRTTSPDLVLTVTVVVGGAPVLFVSEDGECTVGMAEKMSNVTGSFVCQDLTSADGRVKLKITGTYQT